MLWDLNVIVVNVHILEQTSVASMKKFVEILEKVLGVLLWCWTTLAVVLFAVVCSVVWIPVLLLVYVNERLIEGQKAKDIIDVEIKE